MPMGGFLLFPAKFNKLGLVDINITIPSTALLLYHDETMKKGQYKEIE